MKIRVLYFVDRMLRGGIQTFVIENMKHMDRDKIQIDYLLLDDGKHYELEDTLKTLGSNVYKLEGIWLRSPTDYMQYAKALKFFFQHHSEYEVVHLHSSSKNWMVLYCAKKAGIPVRIAHSHNIGFQTTSKAQLFLANAFKPLLKKYATDYFACSVDAGKWLFGDADVTVVKNAVDLQRFLFDQKARAGIREKLNLGNAFVVGNVARFTEQKNQKYLLDIFYELLKNRKNARLLLVGAGEKQAELESYAKDLQIEKYIIFAGFHDNVEQYMSAMDVFVFPSKYEGLGLVLIEAQANGLPCFTSKGVVPEEARVSEQLTYLDLAAGPAAWAKMILESDKKRKDVSNQIIAAGYTIEDTAKTLEDFYLGKVASSKR